MVRLADRLRQQPIRSGDSLLIDRRIHFAFERVPKLDVEELVLEEVPDIDYTVIGGWAPRSRRSETPWSCRSCTASCSPSTS